MSQNNTLYNNLKLLKESFDATIEINTTDINQIALYSETYGFSIDELFYDEIEIMEQEMIQDIKLFVMDCDGVLTDGGMYFSKNGDEIKRFNAKDGLGIKQLQKEGMLTGIISAGTSTGLVEGRASMLGINHVYVGKERKLDILNKWLAELNIDISEVAYIGDDLSDLEIINAVGLSATPADGHDELKKSAHIVLTKLGGQGCVRELIDHYLLAGL